MQIDFFFFASANAVEQTYSDCTHRKVQQSSNIVLVELEGVDRINESFFWMRKFLLWAFRFPTVCCCWMDEKCRNPLLTFLLHLLWVLLIISNSKRYKYILNAQKLYKRANIVSCINDLPSITYTRQISDDLIRWIFDDLQSTSSYNSVYTIRVYWIEMKIQNGILSFPHQKWINESKRVKGPWNAFNSTQAELRVE